MSRNDPTARPRSSTPPSPSGMPRSVLFGASERAEAGRLIDLALEEDLPGGDITSDALFPDGEEGRPAPRVRMDFVFREPGVVSGLDVAEMLYGTIDTRVRLRPRCRDGEAVESGGVVLEVTGPARSILSGERIALNFLQRLSAIASETSRWVREVEAARPEGARPVLLDTRKTTPGWRHLEKYAVRCGGGANHRQSLSDGILVKDNHIWVLSATGRSDPGEWVRHLRAERPGAFLQVEVDTREQFLEIRALAVDAILLDNFEDEDLLWAVERNREAGGRRPLLEASGGIRIDRLASVARTGVDRISVGALTHSVRAIDISLESVEVLPSSTPEE